MFLNPQQLVVIAENGVLTTDLTIAQARSVRIEPIGTFLVQSGGVTVEQARDLLLNISASLKPDVLVSTD